MALASKGSNTKRGSQGVPSVKLPSAALVSTGQKASLYIGYAVTTFSI